MFKKICHNLIEFAEIIEIVQLFFFRSAKSFNVHQKEMFKNFKSQGCL